MNTNQGKRMDKERIAELRLLAKHLQEHTDMRMMLGKAVDEMLDRIIALQAEAADARETLERGKSQRDGGLDAQDRLHEAGEAGKGGVVC